MTAFAQSPFQVEWVIVVVIFYYFHFQVGWLVGLDVYLDEKKFTKGLMNYSKTLNVQLVKRSGPVWCRTLVYSIS